MSALAPIDVLFGGMGQLGPGSDDSTLRALRRLPAQTFNVVVDAGCGTGRSTLALARALGGLVHAIDAHAPFLVDLGRRAEVAGIAHLVRAHHMDMKDIPAVFPAIDLLWSEGAAYSIGFANALAVWADAIRAGGFAVVSELCWLSARPPDEVRAFFASAYPGMRAAAANRASAEAAGYEVLATQTLPRDAWITGYYAVLEPRARQLVEHPDAGVSAMAEETLREIEVFERSADAYGYVLYLLRRLADGHHGSGIGAAA
jgi:SAM-dependent methyltransferase